MNFNWKIINLGIFVLLLSCRCLGFDSGKTGYVVNVGAEKTEYQLMSFFVLPKQSIKIEVSKAGKSIPFEVAGISKPNGKMEWLADATPGLRTLVIRPKDLPATTVQMFILHPISKVKNRKLNGYTIGDYPKDVYLGLNIYKPPAGFVEVTQLNQDMLVSPHYTLRQFLCKQSGGFPKYVALQTKLLRKLEFLTSAMNQKGFAMEHFTVMSGFRTPHYNAAIKNKKYSRHQWGDAADIYVDVNPKDGVMDDLNKDGKINELDSQFLWDMVESFYRESPEYKGFIGGLGLYKANASHGPFVHVDVRGSRARW